jgi:MFS family permease
MGIIGAAFGVGMVVGPVIGGLTSELDPKAPFYVVAGFAALNLVVAWWTLPETKQLPTDAANWAELRASLIPTPVRVFTLVHEKRIGLYLYLFFHIFSSIAILEALITLYAGKQFGKGPFDVGLLFMWIGVVLTATQGVVLGRMANRMGETRLVVIGLVTMGLGLGGVAVAPTFWWFYAVGAVIAFGQGITFPSFTSLYSQACQAESAGELMGQSQAMGTTGRIIGPILGGLIMTHWTPQAPFMIAGGLMIVALMIFWLFRRVLVHNEDVAPSV